VRGEVVRKNETGENNKGTRAIGLPGYGEEKTAFYKAAKGKLSAKNQSQKTRKGNALQKIRKKNRAGW